MNNALLTIDKKYCRSIPILEFLQEKIMNPIVKFPLRDHETTILHILGTEILGLFQNDLLSNFKLEMTTEHIPALSRSLFCCFLAIRKRLILEYGNFFEEEKIIS